MEPTSCNSESQTFDSDSSERNEVIAELSPEAQVRKAILQPLLEPCDRATYGERLREASQKLGRSVRTVQRMVKDLEQNGLSALEGGRRSDKGHHPRKSSIPYLVGFLLMGIGVWIY